HQVPKSSTLRDPGGLPAYCQLCPPATGRVTAARSCCPRQVATGQKQKRPYWDGRLPDWESGERLAAAALLGHQEVDDFQHVGLARGAVTGDAVLAVDHQVGNTADAVGAHVAA